MKLLFTFFLLIITSLSLQAQNQKEIIYGKITNGHHQPLSYVTIMLKGANVGTVTDEKGNYLMKAQVGEYILVVRSIGFTEVDKQITLQNGQSLNVSLSLNEDARLMQDVVVSGVKVKSATATRTLLQLQDIPQDIVVVGQKVIQQQAAYDLTTITRNISGLNFTGNYSGLGSEQFFNARGFDLNDAQSYRLNGMMIWNLGSNYSDNIEQVEFLKGPTSILFGDVSPGGVMNFVTKKPLDYVMANVNFKTGSWGLVRPAIDVTGPLTNNHALRFRLNTSYESTNSFRNYVSAQQGFVAPTLVWDITPKLSLDIEAVFKKSRSTDDAGLVSPDGTISGLKKLSPSLYLGEPSRNYLYNDQSYYGTLTYGFSKAWRLRITGFYGNTTNRPFGIWFDQPDSSGNFARRTYGYYQHSVNGTVLADAYGTFYTGPVKHNVLAGIEYQSTHYRFTNVGELSLLDTNNIYHPVNGVTSNIAPAKGPYYPYVSLIERRGIYLQDQMMLFNEKLHLLAGFRTGQTRQGNHYYQNELAGTQFEGYTDDIITKNVFTPRVGLVYKPQPWVSLYASYSKGYEINSPDVFAQNYKQYASPPATISSQVEIGSKANLINNQLGVTLSFFQIDKHNPYGYVYLDPVHPDYDLYNVYYQGHHRSRGIELDADGRITHELSVTGGAAYTSTKVVYDPGYPAGNVLPNAPKYTANFWLNYEPAQVLKGFSFGTGFFYKDKFFSSLANDPNLQIPASYTLDVATGYKYKQISLQLNVMNLTNQVSYLNPWQFNLFDVKPLRQYIITLNYQISKRK